MNIPELDLHPDFPGPPQVRELLSGFWPFTVGRRATLGALQILSLVLFGLAASLPIQVGSLLSSALGRQSDEQALQTYVLALRMASLRLTQRGVQFAGRHLQDAVFSRIHDTALVDAYALAKRSMVSRCIATRSRPASLECSTFPRHIVRSSRSWHVQGNNRSTISSAPLHTRPT